MPVFNVFSIVQGSQLNCNQQQFNDSVILESPSSTVARLHTYQHRF